MALGQVLAPLSSTTKVGNQGGAGRQTLSIPTGQAKTPLPPPPTIRPIPQPPIGAIPASPIPRNLSGQAMGSIAGAANIPMVPNRDYSTINQNGGVGSTAVPYGPTAPTQAQTMATQYGTWAQGQQDGLWNTNVQNTAYANLVNGANNSALQNSANNALALNNIGSQQNALDQNQLVDQANNIGTQRDIANAQTANDQTNLDSQWNIRQGQWQSQEAYIQQSWGITNEQYVNDQKYFAQDEQRDKAEYGFNQREYDLAQRDNQLNTDVNRRSAQSDAAARGAFGSSGFAQNLSDIQTQSVNQGDRNVLGLDKANASTDKTLADLYHNHDNGIYAYQQAGAAEQQQLAQGQSALASDQSTYTHNTNQNQLSNEAQNAQFDAALNNNQYASQGLDLIAKSYGIKATDIQQTLASALQKNGLNLNQTIAQINQAYQSGNQAIINQTNQFITGLIGAQ